MARYERHDTHPDPYKGVKRGAAIAGGVVGIGTYARSHSTVGKVAGAALTIGSMAALYATGSAHRLRNAFHSGF